MLFASAVPLEAGKTDRYRGLAGELEPHLEEYAGLNRSFDVARHAVAADDAGDFGFHVDPTDPTRVTVIALGSAGLADDAPPAAAHPIDRLAARCLAPEAGYVAGDTLVGNTSNTMYFARLADGVHHARLRIRVYGRGPTPTEGYRVQIESWFAAMGGRNVCESPREGEANEFAKADRGR